MGIVIKYKFHRYCNNKNHFQNYTVVDLLERLTNTLNDDT